MTAKEYLNSLRRMDMIINQKQQELDMALKNRTYIRSMDYSADRVQSSPNGAGFTTMSDKYADLQLDINNAIDELVSKRHFIIEQIQGLTKVEFSEVLFKRYVEYKSFEQISCEMGYVYNYTCNIHGEALKDFEQKYPNVLN